jgi:exonuclease SbcC
MITRIELKNFMSHVDTVIEPAPGLTVLVGPNNVGKSAIVAALQILCYNDNSTYILRHGERECSIRVETDDGHRIEWRRKNSPSYLIDDRLFDRLRQSGIPAELHQALRLPSVDAGNDGEFDIHFGCQKSPIFLLNDSAATAARFFASSSDASRLVAIQKRHKEKLSEAQREKLRLDDESTRLNEALECLQPIVELDRRLESVEQAHRELSTLDQQLVELRKKLGDLSKQRDVFTRYLASSDALMSLAAPPELSPVGPLATLIESLERGKRERASADQRSTALSKLSVPPAPAQTAPLECLIDAVDATTQAIAAAKSLVGATAALAAPPALSDTSSIARLVATIERNTADAERGDALRVRFAQLIAPPSLAETNPLQRLIERLETSQLDWLAATGRSAALAELETAPEIAKVAELDRLIADLGKANSESRAFASRLEVLRSVAEPPAPAETAALDTFITRLQQAEKNARSLHVAVKSADDELRQAGELLRQEAATSVCELCGSALDPDRVLQRAAAGLGGHGHD